MRTLFPGTAGVSPASLVFALRAQCRRDACGPRKERVTEIGAGFKLHRYPKDGAYWNEDEGIWETKEQYESKTFDPSLELAREVAGRTAWMETPGQIAVNLMLTPGPKIGILGFFTKRIVRQAATKALINITQKGIEACAGKTRSRRSKNCG